MAELLVDRSSAVMLLRPHFYRMNLWHDCLWSCGRQCGVYWDI